jgi:predicted ABC-type ATPase
MELTNTLMILAGPNGSGKSFISRKIKSVFPGLDYISPDDLAKANYAGIEDQGLRHYQFAAPETERIVLEAIRQRKTIMMETVLSSDHKWHLLEAARQAGMIVRTIFVTTCDVQINIRRVARRAAQGGHDVPENKIISRYVGSMQRLGRLILLSDECTVYDNSQDGADPAFVFMKACGNHFLIDSDDPRFSWLYEQFDMWIQEGVCSLGNSFYFNAPQAEELDAWKIP